MYGQDIIIHNISVPSWLEPRSGWSEAGKQKVRLHYHLSLVLLVTTYLGTCRVVPKCSGTSNKRHGCGPSKNFLKLR